METERDPEGVSRLTVFLALVGTWAAYFGFLLLPGRVFSFRDLFFFHRPLREVFVRSLLAGHAPFLNPGLNLGQPLLADPSYSVFYPANLLFLALPFDLAWNLVLAGHALFAAAGLYVLARALGATRTGALAGALVFEFSGPMLSALGYYSGLLVFSWVPWVVFLVLRAAARGGRSVPLAGLALGLQTLAPEPAALLGTAALSTACVLALLKGSAERGRVLLRAGLAASAGVLVAAVQLLPTILWLPHSGRAGGLDFRASVAWFSLHPARLLELVVPFGYGDAMATSASAFWGGALSDSGYPYLPRLAVGFLPLLLAPLALRLRAGRAALALVGASLVLALGHHVPGFQTLCAVFPPLRILRYPEKMVLFAALGLALLLALALSTKPEGRAGRWSPLIVALALAAWVALAFVAVPAGLSPEQLAGRSAAFARAALLLAATTLVAVLFARGRLRGRALLAVPLVALLDVGSSTWNVPETSPLAGDRPPALLEAVPELRSTAVLPVVELESDAFFSAGVPPQVALREGLYPYAGLRDGIAYGVATDVARTMSRGSAERRSRILSAFPGPTALAELRRAGIGFVVSTKPISAPGLEEVARVAVSPRLEVVVSKLLGGWAPRARLLRGPGSVSVEESAPHLLRLHVDVPGPADVVLTRDAIPGWSALSGERVGRTSDGLLAVSVSKGVHDLTLRYRPPGFEAGLALAVAGMLLAGYLVARPIR
ncbi:MAG: hypothetical protein JNK60_20465 [Acidobacteria bacterium]|nr:hypothetical protein [Acidobacteriota bacterium]